MFGILKQLRGGGEEANAAPSVAPIVLQDAPDRRKVSDPETANFFYGISMQSLCFEIR